ncbi:peritrophin-1-like [Tribolium madens]|uniref:peritrophin-1-like n=1 Tax=Tribolium madens TaxID=41895 RepID=UPI001CF764B6|nr:peritrophin-1-like [Tribolium madens]
MKAIITTFALLYYVTVVTPRATIRDDITQACKDQDPSQITFIPVPGDCNKYIECYNEVGMLLHCPEGLWWHPAINDCDYPGSYCQENTTTPTTTTPTTTTPTTPTPTPTPTTTTTTTTTTPTSTPTPTPTPTPTTTITTPTPEPTPSPNPDPNPDPRCIDDSTQLWPHPATCAKYVECFHGNSYEMTCPPGLYFSSSHKKCVNAEESDCCKTSSQC